MSNPSVFTEQERADLIAYLDGELEGDAARAIEQKLALDPAARAEADSLKRTWDLLDFLPKKEPSPSFTHKTLTRLGPTATKSLTGGRRRKPWWRKALFGTGWAATVALSAIGGFAGYNHVTPKEPGDPELVRDLNVIKNKRLFEVVDDVEFIRDLDTPDLFGADSPGS